jgi:hypothetical protein
MTIAIGTVSFVKQAHARLAHDLSRLSAPEKTFAAAAERIMGVRNAARRQP